MDTGFDPRVQLSHRRVDVGETASDLYFELGIGQLPRRSDPSQHPTRDQVQRDAVRVVDDDYIVDPEAQLRSCRPSCLNCASKFIGLHTVSLSAEYTNAPGDHSDTTDVLANIVRRPIQREPAAIHAETGVL